MSDDLDKSGYEAPSVTEAPMDDGGNYAPMDGDTDLGTLGSTVDGGT